MNTKETEETRALLLALTARFVAWPGALKLGVQEAGDGSAYFALQGHAKDEPVLIGARGSHVDALAIIVQEIGRAAGRKFTFRLITSAGKFDRKPEDPRDVVSYDPRPAVELLNRLLASLDLGEFAVAHGPGDGVRQSLTYLFAIKLREERDVAALTASREIEGPGRREPQTLIGALGTLFRAIAKKEGVRITLSVEPLKLSAIKP